MWDFSHLVQSSPSQHNVSSLKFFISSKPNYLCISFTPRESNFLFSFLDCFSKVYLIFFCVSVTYLWISCRASVPSRKRKFLNCGLLASILKIILFICFYCGKNVHDIKSTTPTLESLPLGHHVHWHCWHRVANVSLVIFNACLTLKWSFKYIIELIDSHLNPFL